MLGGVESIFNEKVLLFLQVSQKQVNKFIPYEKRWNEVFMDYIYVKFLLFEY